jgi:hypothetical protein
VSDLNPFTIQHIAAGVVRERSADGRLYIYNVENDNPLTIQSWATNVKEVLSAWPSQQVCLLMHDLHKIGQFPFDKSMTERLDDLYGFRPELERYIAYVSPNMDTIVNLFITSHLLNVNGNHGAHWKLYNSRREALNWLIKLRNEMQ